MYKVEYYVYISWVLVWNPIVLWNDTKWNIGIESYGDRRGRLNIPESPIKRRRNK